MTHHARANHGTVTLPHGEASEAWLNMTAREFQLFTVLHGLCHQGEIDTEMVSGAAIRTALERQPDGLLAACFAKFPGVHEGLRSLVGRGVLVPLPGRIPPNEVYHVLMPIADREAQS